MRYVLRSLLPSQPSLDSFVPFFTASALERFILRLAHPCLAFLTILSLILNLFSPLVAPSTLPVASAGTDQSSSRNNAPLASSAIVSASPESDSAIPLAAATATATRQPIRVQPSSTLRAPSTAAPSATPTATRQPTLIPGYRLPTPTPPNPSSAPVSPRTRSSPQSITSSTYSVPLIWARSIESDTISSSGIGVTTSLSAALQLATYPQNVWDNGTWTPAGNKNAVPPGYQWASWSQKYGVDVRHFKATFTFPSEIDPTTAVGVIYDPYYVPDSIPINDNLYIYVNGVRTWHGGTSYGASRAWDFAYETDGWYIPNGASVNGFITGTNVIDVLTEEYATWGGLGYLELRFGPRDASLPNSFIHNTCRSKGEGPPDSRVCPWSSSTNEAIYPVGDPINTRTGGVDYTTVDLSFPALGGQMAFQRSYSSLVTSTYTTTLGYGWTHNQDTRLILPTQPGGVSGQVLFKPHNANQLIFYSNPDGTYTPYAGVLGKLISTTVPAGYQVTASDQSVYNFDTSGHLLTWADAQGHSWTYSYTNTLSAGPRSVTNPATDIVDVPGSGVAWTNPSNAGVSDNLYATVTLDSFAYSHLLQATNFGFAIPSNSAITGIKVEIERSVTVGGIVDYTSARLHKGGVPTGEQKIDTTEWPTSDTYFTYGGQNDLWNISWTPADVNASDFGVFIVVYSYSTAATFQIDHIRMTVYYTDPNVMRLARVQDSTGSRFLNLDYDAQGRLSTVSDPLGRTVQYSYDANGDLSSVTDARGKVWTYHYDGTSHRLNQIIDPYSNTVERTEYDAQGRAVRQFDAFNVKTYDIKYNANNTRVITDSLTHVITATYDSRGTLVTLQDAAGPTRKWFDGNFRPSQIADPNTNFTTLTWSGDGANLTRVVDAQNRTTSLFYDNLNNLTRTVDALGRTSNFNYSGKLLTRSTDALGNTTLYTYTAQGFLSAMTDARWNTTSYAYNQFGQRTSMTDTLGSVTSWQYDGVGRLITTTDAFSRTTVNAYDNGDHLIQVTQNYNAGQSQNHQNQYNIITRYGYDDVGRRTTITDTLGRVTLNEYDPAGRMIKVTQNYLAGQPKNYQNERNIVTQYGYDLMGHQTLITDTADHVTRNTYDSANRLATVTQNYWAGQPQNYQNQYNLITTNGYDPAGNVITRTDTLTRTTITRYDQLNRPVTVTTNYINGVFDSSRPDEDLITITAYDEVGNVATTTDPLSRVTRTEYDPLNRPRTVTANYMSGQPKNYQNQYNIVTEYGYDWVGNRVAITDTLEHVTQNEYDPLNRVSRVTQNVFAGQPQNWLNEYNLITTYGYNAVGSRIAITDTLERVSRSEYDALNRVSAQVDALNQRTGYTYDALGNRLTTTDPLSHTTSLNYDTLNRVITTTQPLTTVTVVGYDALSNRLRTVDPRGNATRFGYDALNRTTLITDANNYTTTMAYDPVGRRLSQMDALGHSATFTYDRSDRQLTATDALTHTTRWGYDAIGNRVVMTDANEIATQYGYDKLSRLTSVTENYVSGGPTNNQTNVRTQYAYDAIGNRLSISDGLGHPTTFNYDTLSRVITTTDALNNRTTYTYNPVGQRTTLTDAKSQSTLYTYDSLDRLSSVVYSADTASASQGPNNVSATTDISGDGWWMNPGNARLSDNFYATCTLAAAQYCNAYLKATNFGFAIPPNATIVGIKVEIEKSATVANTITEYVVELVIGGVVQSQNKATSSVWPTTDTYTTYGNENDLWGYMTLTPADVNAPNFGTAILVRNIGPTTSTAQVDHMRMTVYYAPTSAQTTAIAYDAVGNRMVMTDTLGVTRYTYDDLNRLTQVKDPFNQTVGYGYDSASNRTTLTYPDSKVVTYTYNLVNQMTSVRDWNNATTFYGYDAANRPITATLPNTVTTSYNYDNANRLTMIEYDRGTTVLERVSYILDAVGNRTRQSESILDVESGVLAPKPAPTFPNRFFFPFLGQGGGNAPLVVPSPTATARASATATPSATALPKATIPVIPPPVLVKTATPSATAQVTATSSRTASPQPTNTPTAVQPSNTPTRTPSQTSTLSPTHSATPPQTPTKASASEIYGIVLVAFQSAATPTRTPTIGKAPPATATPTRTPTIGEAPPATATPTRTPTIGKAPPPATATLTRSITPTPPKKQALPTATPTKTLATNTKTPTAAPTVTRTQTARDITRRLSPDAGDTVIDYTYDPLYRLTGATFTGSYTATISYTLDAVGNRTVQTQTITSTVVTNYGYDIANRLTSVNGQTYTWDNNGNLLTDGTSTNTYDQANRLKTVTQGANSYAFAYNGVGDRLRQSVSGITTTIYALDPAAGLTQVLSDGSSTYLYGPSTGSGQASRLAQQATTMQYFGADGLGSIRQIYNSSGQIIANKRYDPFGNVLAQNGVGTSNYGYTGEWMDSTGLEYLRARYYAPTQGRFTTRDTWSGDPNAPMSYNAWNYTNGNPVNITDPSGHVGALEKLYIKYLYESAIKDASRRLNMKGLTNLSNEAFAAMIAAKVLVEDATVFADFQPDGLFRQITTIPPTVMREPSRGWLEKHVFGGEISWGPANIPLPLELQNLKWWEENCNFLTYERSDLHTNYYDVRDRDALSKFFWNERDQIIVELQTNAGAVEATALAIRQSTWRAEQFYGKKGDVWHPVSAYIIALGVNQFRERDETLYILSNWKAKGSQWDWTEAIAVAGEVLGLNLSIPRDYIPYTDAERQKLDTLPK